MSFPLPSDYDELDKLWARTDGSMCFICHMFETFDGGEPYEVCFECGHVFRTPAEIVAEYERDVDWIWDRAPSEIPFCPMCLHDW